MRKNEIKNANFNSIKVRLKQAAGSIRASIREERRFQFHKGTIKTIYNVYTCNLIFDFNSIKVRLKQYRHDMDVSHLYYFNSIKVRLKHVTECTKDVYRIFQFHKGTIKTLCFCSNWKVNNISIP